MAITEVQYASGADSAITLGSDATVGNTVILCVAADPLSGSPSGLGATWSLITTLTTVAGWGAEIWAGVVGTSGEDAITPPSSASAYAIAVEFAGVDSVTTGGTNSGTGTSQSLTLSPGAGNAAFVFLNNPNTSSFSESPASPWAAVANSSWGGFRAAWQTMAADGSTTATWTASGTQWSTGGVILTQPVAAPPPGAFFF